MPLCLVFNFKVGLCSEARNYTINGSISKNLSNLNDWTITFMKCNWLKPISFTLIFEFEVDPYMEWLRCLFLRQMFVSGYFTLPLLTDRAGYAPAIQHIDTILTVINFWDKPQTLQSLSIFIFLLKVWNTTTAATIPQVFNGGHFHVNSSRILGYNLCPIQKCDQSPGGGGGFLVQRSIWGRAAEMGLKISLLV